MAICSECNQTISHGDWPFCNKGGGHSPARGSDAQDFIPPMIFRNAEGHVLFPGRSDEKPPKGYEAVELRTSNEIHRFEKEFEGKLRHDHHNEKLLEQLRQDYYSKPKIEELKRNIKRIPANLRGYAEKAIERYDKRSHSSDATKNSPRCVFEAFSYDSNNRMGCDDPRTTNSRQRR